MRFLGSWNQEQLKGVAAMFTAFSTAAVMALVANIFDFGIADIEKQEHIPEYYFFLSVLLFIAFVSCFYASHKIRGMIK